jgi:hypothetical protein
LNNIEFTVYIGCGETSTFRDSFGPKWVNCHSMWYASQKMSCYQSFPRDLLHCTRGKREPYLVNSKQKDIFFMKGSVSRKKFVRLSQGNFRCKTEYSDLEDSAKTRRLNGQRGWVFRCSQLRVLPIHFQRFCTTL